MITLILIIFIICALIFGRFVLLLILLGALGLIIALNKPKKDEPANINTTVTVSALPETTDVDRLKGYKELLDSGAITQEEYEQKKKEILGL